MENKSRVHIIVSGCVHGVTFRKRARRLGLTGWVKNIFDGVEAVIEGDTAKVKQVTTWMVILTIVILFSTITWVILYIIGKL